MQTVPILDFVAYLLVFDGILSFKSQIYINGLP